MQIGVTFPQNEIGNDPAVIRDYAQTAEGLGFTHIVVYDHVLGADTATRPDWGTRYSKADAFHEPFVLFGYLAGITSRIEMVSGVIILPQRQTALVAKQVAEIDVLSGGRVRLGIGTGWNEVEYQALGADFRNRGRQQEEQIDVLRALWEHETIDYAGRWHRVDRAGINPRPTRRIPIWFGGRDEKMLRRAARLGDGWLPMINPGGELDASLAIIRETLAEHGREADSFGIEGAVAYSSGDDRWARHLEGWQAAGATHVTMRTFDCGLRGAEHIDAIRRYADGVKDWL